MTLNARRACFFCCFTALLLLAGCGDALPGGNENVNNGAYASSDDLKQCIDDLKPGMSEAEVFARVGRSKDNVTRLDRADIVSALFGGRDAGIPSGFVAPGSTDTMAFLQSLEAYQFEYRNVKSRHGFTSLIRIRTEKKGFDYIVTLIFSNGRLLEKPILSGGDINSTSSKTLFDYLTPAIIMNEATP